MKIAHIADIHLGYSQYGLIERFNDFGRTWLDVCDIVASQKCSICMLAGDLFHHRVVNPETLSFAIAGLDKLQKRGIITLAVEGNHEQARTSSETGWMQFLETHGYLILLNELSEHRFEWDEHLVFYGFPWLGHATNRILDNFTVKNPFGNNVLLLHAGYEGMDMGNYPGTISNEVMKKLKKQCNYIALGHIHKPYAKDKVYNPGSPETVSATEAEWPNRGVIIWDTETNNTSKFIPIRRRFYRVNSLPKEIDPQAIYDVQQEPNPDVKTFHTIVRKSKQDKVVPTYVSVVDLIRSLSDLDPNLVLDIKNMILNNIGVDEILERL